MSTPNFCDQCRGEGIDAHLLAAVTLIATEDECVLLGPWTLTPAGVGFYVQRLHPVGEFMSTEPLWFRIEEDARAVCAALNRNHRVREIGTQR